MKQNLALIASSGKRLTSLISNIQDLTRLKHRDIVLNIEDVDLGKVIGIITAIFRLLIDESSVRITKAHPEDLPYVKADENRLVYVKDNGVGMSAERISSILADKGGCMGIGLKNVNERLRLHYGQGLIIESWPGEGTLVTFEIPNNHFRGR